MDKVRAKDKDLKLKHKIFFDEVCSQIAACEQELDKYNTLKSNVMALKSDLEMGEIHLKNIYVYAQSGIICDDFNSGIDKIGSYATNIQNLNGNLEGVIHKISQEITLIKNEITALKKSIGI